MISRRNFFKLVALTTLEVLTQGQLARAGMSDDWRDLLIYYGISTHSNIVDIEGRRALLSSRIYPGTYIRDALFWGPLGLGDARLGYECYQWFAETQLESGQIRSAVPLHSNEAARLTPQDDEGTLLFVIASDWLQRNGYQLDQDRITRAYAWVQSHVHDHTYMSQPGPFRYWVDCVSPNVSEAICHNQGLLCLARRAMGNMGLGEVGTNDIATAQTRYQSFYDNTLKYLTLGKYSNFAKAQDVSAVFPEFLSRYLYNEGVLTDEMIVNHVERILGNASVYFTDGKPAGIKVISSATGDFLPQDWFYAPGLNCLGDYQNGAHWPMYSIVALALAYACSSNRIYADWIIQLIINELALDHQSKELIRLTPGAVGTFDPSRSNYTWNALIRTACDWCGITRLSLGAPKSRRPARWPRELE